MTISATKDALIQQIVQKGFDNDRRHRAAKMRATGVHPKRKPRIGKVALTPNHHAILSTGVNCRNAIEQAKATSIVVPDVVSTFSNLV